MRLRQSLGDAWQDDWLSRGLPAVPRPLLPLALREGLEAAQRKMQEEVVAAGEVRRVAAELEAHSWKKCSAPWKTALTCERSWNAPPSSVSRHWRPRCC
jgi:hypothetical protein